MLLGSIDGLVLKRCMKRMRSDLWFRTRGNSFNMPQNVLWRFRTQRWFSFYERCYVFNQLSGSLRMIIVLKGKLLVHHYFRFSFRAAFRRTSLLYLNMLSMELSFFAFRTEIWFLITGVPLALKSVKDQSPTLIFVDDFLTGVFGLLEYLLKGLQLVAMGDGRNGVTLIPGLYLELFLH